MSDEESPATTVTEDCLKCGERFETVYESDGAGGQTAMTVCDSCFEYVVADDRS